MEQIVIQDIQKSSDIGTGIAPIPAYLSNGNLAIMFRSTITPIILLYDQSLKQINNITLMQTALDTAYWYGSNLGRAIASFKNGGFVVCAHVKANPYPSNWNIWCNIFDNNLNLLSAPVITANNYDNSGLYVSTYNSYYAVCWIAQGGIRAMILENKDNKSTSISGTIHIEYGAGVTHPAIAFLNTGSLLIAYQDGESGVKAKIYSSYGVEINNFRVANAQAALQIDVASTSNNGFVVCWQYYSDSSAQGVKCKTYDASGVQIATEFQVNEYTLNDQAEVSVVEVMNNVVAACYHSDRQDNGKTAVYCRLFDYNGKHYSCANLISKDNPANNAIYPMIATNGSLIVITYATHNAYTPISNSALYKNTITLGKVCSIDQACISSELGTYNKSTQKAVNINASTYDPSKETVLGNKVYDNLANPANPNSWNSVSITTTALTIVGTVVSVVMGICFYKQKERLAAESEQLVVNDILYTILIYGNNLLISIQQSSSQSSEESVSSSQILIGAPPIAISLFGDELQVISLSESSTKFDYGMGLVKTSWIKPSSALLVYDADKSGNVSHFSEIVITSWAENAKTDFEALLIAFDSNKDQIFDQKDLHFNDFMLWRDVSVNGVSEEHELKTLGEAGLLSIDFNTQKQTSQEMQHNGILNTATTHWDDGKMTIAYDLVFFHEGY